MENFEKVTLNDFLVEGKVENKILKISENISSPKYFFKEGFEFNDYVQHKINGMKKEELTYIMESVSKDGIEKAMMVIDHSNDVFLKDIQQSRGNVKNMHYYNTIERMLNDLSLTCAHNQEVMKAREIFFELEKNKQVFVKAYAQDNMYKKTVYVSSIMAAVYTIIKEHLMYTDMTSSKNEGKFVMMHHNTHDVVDKDNLRNLNNNLALIIKKGVNPHAKNSGPRGLTEDASIYDLVANKISRMQPLREDNILSNSVKAGVGAAIEEQTPRMANTVAETTAKALKPDETYKKTNTWFAGIFEDLKGMIKSNIHDPVAKATGKELSERDKQLVYKYFKDKNGMSIAEKRELEKSIGEDGIKFLDTKEQDYILQMGIWSQEALAKLVSFPKVAGDSIKGMYKDVSEYMSDRFDSMEQIVTTLLAVSTVLSLFILKNPITKGIIMYLDSYEYVREAAKKGNSRSDRAIVAILDKVNGLKKFFLRLWKDDKSRNIQDYMKDLNYAKSVVEKYEMPQPSRSPAPQGYENKSKHDGLDFSSIGYANTASYKSSLVKPLSQNNHSNNNSFF